MKNIIKAQLYQIKRDKALWIMFFGIALLNLSGMMNYIIKCNMDKREGLSGSFFGANTSDMGMYCTVYIILAAVYMMGRDYMDKTVNEEVLYGYSGKHVFLGRALPALSVTLITTILLIFLVPVCSTMIYGWGKEITVAEFMFRVFLYVFLILRISCEAILLTVACRKLYVACAAGLILYEAGYFIDVKNEYVFAGTAGRTIFDFESWIIYHINGTPEILYEKILPESTIFIFIASSILISIMCLLLAGRFFEISDMD